MTGRFSLRAVVLAAAVVGSLVLAAPALAVPPTFTTQPQISGTALVGQTLNETPANWSDGTVEIQWLDCDATGNNCSDVASNGNSPAYMVQASDMGFALVVEETATNADGSTLAVSAPTSVVPPPPAVTAPPEITGTPQPGQELTEVRGSWTNNPTSFALQWERCDSQGNSCDPIAGAIGQTYTVRLADLGHRLAVVETASNGDGSGPPATSARTDVVRDPSTTVLSAPTSSVTNQNVTLSARVTSSAGSPSGTVTFRIGGVPISGCPPKPITSKAPTAQCATSFPASTLPDQLTAEFNPDLNSTAGPSVDSATLLVASASTATSLEVTNPTVDIGSSATYTAQVAPSFPSSSGPVPLTGSVVFEDGGMPIARCGAKPIFLGVATCTVRYPRAGTHRISARYVGDDNFTASTSAVQPVTVHAIPAKVLGIIKATMQWTFLFTPTFTTARNLVISGAPVGASVSVTCHGRSCPFRVSHIAIQRPKPCHSTKRHRCHAPRAGTLDLLNRFHRLRHRHLRVGTQIVVMITRKQWIGKYYSFTMRKSHPPRIRIDCLAPGSTKPGKGC